MNAPRRWVRSWLPPALLRLVSSPPAVKFTGAYGSWAEAARQSKGYDTQQILDRVLSATLKVKRGEGAYERDSVVFQQPRFVWPVTTALLWAAARAGGELRVLDFGGALGSCYLQHLTWLDALPSVTWNVVEQPAFVQAGREYVQDERLRFHETVDDGLAAASPNVVLLGSVLQYLELPYDLLRSLVGVDASVVVIDRTPVSYGDDERILVQEVHPTIYDASYAMRVLSMERITRALAPAYRLKTTFECEAGTVPEPEGDFRFMGLIYECSN